MIIQWQSSKLCRLVAVSHMLIGSTLGPFQNNWLAQHHLEIVLCTEAVMVRHANQKIKSGLERQEISN